MWVARNKDGSLFLYRRKPKKIITDGIWKSHNLDYHEIFKPDLWIFPSVKWEDDEPTELSLKR